MNKWKVNYNNDCYSVEVTAELAVVNGDIRQGYNWVKV